MDQLLLDILENERPYAWLYQFFLMALVSMIPFSPIPVLAAFVASHHTFFRALQLTCSGLRSDHSFYISLAKAYCVMPH